MFNAFFLLVELDDDVISGQNAQFILVESNALPDWQSGCARRGEKGWTGTGFPLPDIRHRNHQSSPATLSAI